VVLRLPLLLALVFDAVAMSSLPGYLACFQSIFDHFSINRCACLNASTIARYALSRVAASGDRSAYDG